MKIGFNAKEAKPAKHTNIAPVDFRHILIEGQTGSGKTVSNIYPNLIDRIKRGHSILFPTFKGHESKVVKSIAKECGRLEDLYEIGTPTGSYINLLESVNIEQFKDIISQHYKSSDPYWINTVVNWFSSLHSTISSLHNIYKIAQEIETKDGETIDAKHYEKLYIPLPKSKKSQSHIMYMEYINLKEYPSFKTLAPFTGHPRRFLQLLKGLSNYFEVIEIEIKKTITTSHAPKHLLQRLYVEFQKAKEKAHSILHVSLEEKGSSGGNNGVLEMLNNLLQILAQKEYFNKSEEDILQLLENRKIVIVDLESLPQFLQSIFYLSIADRLVRRIKTQTELTPISIFIDEANKILPENIELYNDVFRESKIELFLSYQSEDQMIEKFGYHKWSAFKENFAHRYFIQKRNDERVLLYNDEPATITNPYLFTKEQIDDADADYYALEHNKKRIYDRFIFDSLPNRFSVSYSAKMFEQEGVIEVKDLKTGIISTLYYANASSLEEFEELFSQNKNHRPKRVFDEFEELEMWDECEPLEPYIDDTDLDYCDLEEEYRKDEHCIFDDHDEVDLLLNDDNWDEESWEDLKKFLDSLEDEEGDL